MGYQNLKSIIIDDEPDACELLSMLLSEIDDIEVLGTAFNVDDGVKLVLETNPDVIFLDIEMPEKNGFDLIHELDYFDQEPIIIFTTAYNEYAIDAIRHAAFDYLLKPIKRVELLKSVNRLKHQQKITSLKEKSQALFQQLNPRHLRFKTINGFVVLKQEDITHCLADGNYTTIYTKGDNKLLVTAYLSSVYDQLPQEHFFRISRSVIINFNLLHRVNRKLKQCELKVDGKLIHLPITQKRIAELDELFKQ